MRFAFNIAFNMLFGCSDALCKGGLVQVTATKLSNVRLWMSGYGRRLRRQGSLVRTLAWPTPTIAPAQHRKGQVGVMCDCVRPKSRPSPEEDK